jgi:16S rRNA (cytosine967-C5)-methyltransferase
MSNYNSVELAHAAAQGRGLGPLIIDLWKSTRIDWSFATDRLAQAFRQRRQLTRDERRFVAETLFGLIRHLRRIDDALRAGGLVAVSAAPDRERLIALLVLEGAVPISLAAQVAPGVDWSAVAEIDAQIARDPDPTRRLARRHSLPEWLAARLVADWGDRADLLAAALNQRAPMTLRVNRLKASRDQLLTALTEQGLDARPGRWCDTAVELHSRMNVFSLKEFGQGWFEVQDEGSQLLAELVAPPPRGVVVDFCAGAGGKTLAIAGALGNRGRVVAADVDRRKLAELRRRAKRAGVSNVQTVLLDGADHLPAPLARLEGSVQRVLVDAPCTGTGALRRNPEARWRMTPADLERMPALQRAIGERALRLVGPGGRLVYATCSVLRCENHDVVRALAAAHPELDAMPVKAVWGKERAADVAGPDGQFLELDPARHGTDGFFAAILRRPA